MLRMWGVRGIRVSSLGVWGFRVPVCGGGSDWE